MEQKKVYRLTGEAAERHQGPPQQQPDQPADNETQDEAGDG